MIRKNIEANEIQELKNYIDEQRNKDIEVASHSSGKYCLRLTFVPITDEYVVRDFHADKEYRFDTFEEAVEKYNDI